MSPYLVSIQLTKTTAKTDWTRYHAARPRSRLVAGLLQQWKSLSDRPVSSCSTSPIIILASPHVQSGQTQGYHDHSCCRGDNVRFYISVTSGRNVDDSQVHFQPGQKYCGGWRTVVALWYRRICKRSVCSASSHTAHCCHWCSLGIRILTHW
jgi:hypothetical protein